MNDLLKEADEQLEEVKRVLELEINRQDEIPSMEYVYGALNHYEELLKKEEGVTLDVNECINVASCIRLMMNTNAVEGTHQWYLCEETLKKIREKFPCVHDAQLKG